MRRIVSPFLLMLAGAFALVLAFAATSHAAGAVENAVAPDDGNLLDVLRQIYAYAVSGHKLAAAASSVVLLVGLLKRYGVPKWPALGSDVGGALTTLTMSFAGTIALDASTSSVAWSTAWAALQLAVTAAGGFVLLKKLLIVPVIKPLISKAPAWMQLPLTLLVEFFDQPDPLADATKAGADAVKASPGQGNTAVTGKPTEL